MTPAHRSTSATRAPHPPWPGRRRRRRCQGAQVPAPTRPVKPRRWPGPAPAGTEPRPGPRSRPPRVQRFAGRPRRRQPMHPRGPGAGANGRGFADAAPKSEGGSRALKRPRLGRLKRWAPASRPSGGRSVGPPPTGRTSAGSLLGGPSSFLSGTCGLPYPAPVSPRGGPGA